MRTYVATLGQKPLWDGELPPIPEGSRLVIGPPGSAGWIVEVAYIHLDGKTSTQTLYVEEASVHERKVQKIVRGARE